MRFGFFGDSIGAGLGVGEGRYPVTLSRMLKADLHDYSHTGYTASDSLNAFRRHPCQLDLAVIAHGTTEPVPRPKLEGIPFVPERWKKLGWTDPRPFYSARMLRRLVEIVESGTRWRFKNLVCALRGPSYLMTRSQFISAMDSLIEEVRGFSPTVRIVILTAGHVDDRYFRGARSQFRLYANAVRHLDSDLTLSIEAFVRPWDDYLFDHFHLNQSGHDRVALGIVNECRNLLLTDLT